LEIIYFLDKDGIVYEGEWINGKKAKQAEQAKKVWFYENGQWKISEISVFAKLVRIIKGK